MVISIWFQFSKNCSSTFHKNVIYLRLGPNRKKLPVFSDFYKGISLLVFFTWTDFLSGLNAKTIFICAFNQKSGLQNLGSKVRVELRRIYVPLTCL